MTFRDCLEAVLAATYRERPFVNLPFGVASMIGKIASMVPLIAPPLTPDQVTMLKKDNVVSTNAEKNGLTLEGIGITPFASRPFCLPTWCNTARTASSPMPEKRPEAHL